MLYFHFSGDKTLHVKRYGVACAVRRPEQLLYECGTNKTYHFLGIFMSCVASMVSVKITYRKGLLQLSNYLVKSNSYRICKGEW